MAFEKPRFRWWAASFDRMKLTVRADVQSLTPHDLAESLAAAVKAPVP